MADTSNDPTGIRERVLAAIAKTSDRLTKAAVDRSFHPSVIRGKTPEQLGRQTRSLLSRVSPHQVSHKNLRRIERNGLSVQRSISFRATMHEMSEARRLGVLRPSWKLDAKTRGYTFADAIGARRPETETTKYTFEDVPKTAPGVVKAGRATGGRGCYLILSEEHIVHVQDNRTFTSREEMAHHAEKMLNSRTNPLRDNWMWEELIMEDSGNGVPARDLKFYAFYGEVLLVRESVRHETTKVAYWDRDGTQVDMGHQQDWDFEGVGFTAEQTKQVGEISRQVPHPFMRIDMLNGEDGLVVGEFTPRPGNFEQFNEEYDRTLGEAWVRAESRLLEDLLRGKRFDEYLGATGLLKKRRSRSSPTGGDGTR